MSYRVKIMRRYSKSLIYRASHTGALGYGPGEALLRFGRRALKRLICRDAFLKGWQERRRTSLWVYLRYKGVADAEGEIRSFGLSRTIGQMAPAKKRITDIVT